MSILTEFQTEQKQQSAKAARRMIRADLLDQKANDIQLQKEPDADTPAKIAKAVRRKNAKLRRCIETLRLAADANRMHGHQAADKAAVFLAAAERHIPAILKVSETVPKTELEPVNA